MSAQVSRMRAHARLNADPGGPGKAQLGAKRCELPCKTLDILVKTFLLSFPLSPTQNQLIEPGEPSPLSKKMISTLHTGIRVVE